MSDTPILALNFRIEGPVELSELTAALDAFHRQYSRHLRLTQLTHSGQRPGSDETKLYVRKLETGSVFTEMVPWVEGAITASTALMPLLEYHEAFRDYLTFAKHLIDAFLNKSEMPEHSEAKCVSSDFADVLAPVARRRNGSLEIALKHETPEGEKTEMLCSFTSDEAMRARTRALELARDRDESRADYSNVILYLPQLNSQTHPQSPTHTADRGVIERIHSKPLKVVWVSEQDSMRVKSAQGNPLRNSYLVDVNVERVQGKPSVYCVVRLHEIFPPEEEEEGRLLP